jgi:tetratricopeptide (TPR) repeat protein
MRRYLIPIAAFVFGIAILGCLVLYPNWLALLEFPWRWLAAALGVILIISALVITLNSAGRAGRLISDERFSLAQAKQAASYLSAYTFQAIPPAPPVHFIGRTEEREKLVHDLSASEWITAIILRGKPGVGKTALAQKLAEELAGAKAFPGGILWWDLGSEPDLLAAFSAWAAFANLSADVTRLPAESRPDFVRDQLTHLGRLFVILDDVRHVEAATTLIKALPPGAVVLLTTRDIDLTGTLNCSVRDLSPFTEDEALALLAKRISPLGKYEDAARELFRLTEGMPLGLELAAGAAGSSANLPALAGQLRQLPQFDDFQLPSGEIREKNMEACLAVNYASLPAPVTLQSRFRALGIFPVPFDEPALFAVWDEADYEALNILLRRNLLLKDKKSGLLSQHRFLNAYARALLRQKPVEESQAIRRHAQYYLNQADQAKEKYGQGGESTRVSLHQFNIFWPHLKTAYENMLQTSQQGNGEVEARWLSEFPEKIIYTLDLHLLPGQMISILETALAAARRLNDKQSESIHLVNLGFAFSTLGILQKAIEYYELALPLKREIGDRRGEGKALGNLGLAYADLGNIRKAIEYYEQQLVITREAHDRYGEGATLRNLGLAYAGIGNSHRAIEYFQQALSVDRQIGDRRSEGRSLGNLGLAYADRRDAQKAIEYYEKALKVTREIGDRRGEGSILGNLGIIYYALGDVYSAIEYYEQHLNITRLIGDRRGEGNALGNLGIAYKKLGDPYMAMEYYEQALVLDQATGDKLGEANDCWNMGLLFEEQGNLSRAAELMQVRVDYLASIGHTEATKYARYLDDVLKKLAERQNAALE